MKRKIMIVGLIPAVLGVICLLFSAFHQIRESDFRSQAQSYGGIDDAFYWDSHKEPSFNTWYTPEEIQSKPDYLKLNDAGKKQTMKEYFSARTGYEDFLQNKWQDFAYFPFAIAGIIYGMLALHLLPGFLFSVWLKFIRETSKAIRGDK